MHSGHVLILPTCDCTNMAKASQHNSKRRNVFINNQSHVSEDHGFLLTTKAMKCAHNLARQGRGRGPGCLNQRKDVVLGMRYGRYASTTAQADNSFSLSSPEHPQKRHVLHKTVSMLKFMMPALILPLSDPLMSLIDAISLGKVCSCGTLAPSSRVYVHRNAVVD